ncbi:MAG: uroporphyrinogen-III synthase [Parvibaculum sp.]|uniref:uroporphyrinogen-III synthase n=1 Tax=Parvibaculum sp. TaxID=2024848 RepID=UPI0025DADA6B|nr:uroporphyrinogen-III synthase [Parvibaculum sp.]MCE9647996.1 uroporphyrinogen-III synthase [Parvibaculum sp.]
MRLLVTRPDEDAGPLLAALAARGHEPVAAPLLTIRFLAEPAIPPAPYQALLVTSANGVRALGARKGELGRLKVFAVGEASAEAASEAGFAEVVSAEGDVASLVRLVAARLSPADGPLLHVAGSVVAGDLKGDLERRGFAVMRAVLYEAVAAMRLPEVARAGLAGGGIEGVLFHSPRTARTFASLAREEGLGGALSPVTAYCLSQAVAEALAGLPFAAVRVAGAPNQSSLLSLIRD